MRAENWSKIKKWQKKLTNNKNSENSNYKKISLEKMFEYKFFSFYYWQKTNMLQLKTTSSLKHKSQCIVHIKK